MRRIQPILFLMLLVAACGFGQSTDNQSLGDVARKSRQKETGKSPTKKKVITNEDIPESPDANPGPSEIDGKARPVPASEIPGGGLSAEQWKEEIAAQKNAIAGLKAQIDKLNDSIRFVEANAYYNGVQYNQHQAKKQQQVEQMRSQLAEQQKQLEAMQEAAKEAGMGSAVYDP